MHNFIEHDVGPNMAVKIQQPLNPDFLVNTEGLKALLAAPPKMRAVVHLLADGSDYRLPIQFRFLSFYKIIELHFKVTTNKTFNAFIEPFIQQFQELYPNVRTVAQLCVVLSKLRNRCAHIKLTTGDLGFSHPEAELEEPYKVLPVLKRVVGLTNKVIVEAMNRPAATYRYDLFIVSSDHLRRKGSEPKVQWPSHYG